MLRAIAQIAHALEIVRTRHDHAALALDRLDQDRDGLVVIARLSSAATSSKGTMLKARHQRLEAAVIFFLAGRAQGAERAAVERAERRDDLEAAGAAVVAPAARELDRRLVGLGAGVAKRTRARRRNDAHSRAASRAIGSV